MVKFVTVKFEATCSVFNDLSSLPVGNLQRLLFLSGRVCIMVIEGRAGEGGGGGGGGGAALKASVRFVRKCVQVNTFCSRPSVRAQICMRAGRGDGERDGRREEERKEGWKGDEEETRDEEENSKASRDTNYILLSTIFSFDLYLLS